LYVCDTALFGSGNSPWYVEDDIQVIDFARVNEVLYALTADGRILKFNDDSDNEVVQWYAETEKFDYNYLGNTISLKVKIEAELEAGASIRIYIRTGEGLYQLKDTYVYDEPRHKYYTTVIEPERAESFQIKIEGEGKAKVLSVVRDFLIGSDKE
jgi:hypothetical protein